MKISVFGTGYVGLVTGTCFAEVGNEVVCADIDQQKIEKLRNGKSPIYEPGLEDLLDSNIKAQRISFTTDLRQAVQSSDILFIAVGTPTDEDGSADLQYVLSVAKTIGEHMTSPKIVVNKSTVPVGTGQAVKKAILSELNKRQQQIEFEVVSNPEFLKEGSAIQDCLRPARVVVGTQSSQAREMMERLYKPFFPKDAQEIYFMDIASAEMTKYAANAMLATKISFMNEISRLCEKSGADIESVRLGIGSDPRIGHQFLYAGVGYGGSCFPKDVRALMSTGHQHGIQMSIIESVEKVNAEQREFFFNKIKSYFSPQLKGKTIALWGLAFKPGTDDVREAPALYLAQALIDAGASVRAFDPVAIDTAKYALGEVSDKILFAQDQYSLLEGADALAIVTEWKSFREPNFNKMKSILKAPLIFDGRNLYDQSLMSSLGFSYFSIGRAASK